MNSADVVCFRGLDGLPGEASALFANPRDDLFGSMAWYRLVLTCGMPDAAKGRFMLCHGIALFPMQAVDHGLASLTTMYTCRYHPLLRSEVEPTVAVAAFKAFARACRAWPITRLDAVPADWPHRTDFDAAARDAGLAVREFDHFGNWHEMVRGVTWDSYLESRPGQLRQTIRRKLRRGERDCRFSVITGVDQLEAGVDAFEHVYRRSWKEPEPFPEFNANLMRAAAPLGLLRLGLLHIGPDPVAAQLWIIERDRATVLKLAHDEAFKAASPGTVLTAMMLRRLLDEEHVTEIDFGRGDDAYKAGWAAERRQRIGLVLANRLHPRGMAFLGRHALGRARAALRH